MSDTTHAAALRRRILEAVDAEVDRADRIHGDHSISHPGPDERFLALAALTEEVGELAQALIDTRDDGDEVGQALVEAVQASRLTGDERLSESFYRMAVLAVVGLVPTLPTWGSELLLTRSQALQVIGLIAIETLISEGDR